MDAQLDWTEEGKASATLSNPVDKHNKEAAGSGDRTEGAEAGKDTALPDEDDSEGRHQGGSYWAESPEEENAECGTREGAFLPS